MPLVHCNVYKNNLHVRDLYCGCSHKLSKNMSNCSYDVVFYEETFIKHFFKEPPGSEHKNRGKTVTLFSFRKEDFTVYL